MLEYSEMRAWQVADRRAVSESIINIGNSWSSVEGFIPPELAEVLGQSVVSFRKVRNPLTGQKETKHIVKFITLYKNGVFPSGLLTTVYEQILRYGGTPVLCDKRVLPISSPYPQIEEIPIREQMKEGFEKAVSVGRGVFNYTVASGKTNFAAKVIATLGLKTLYIVPSIGLLKQVRNELSRFIDTSIGIIGDKENDIQYTEQEVIGAPNILICTVSSLWSIFKNEELLFKYLIDNTEVLIIDECHHIRQKASAYDVFNTWYRLCLKFKNAYYRIGLTGSLYKPDDIGYKMLCGVTGKVQAVIDRQEAEESGYVCPFEARIYTVQCPQYRSWQDSYKYGIVYNDRHNSLVVGIARELVREGRKVLVIFDEVKEHLFKVKDSLPEAAVLTGDDDGDTRICVQNKFADGEIPIILSSVMSEGINVPGIDAIILASGKGADNTAHIKVTQRIGRGSRISDGKENLIVVDFLHKGNKILHKHSLNRIQVMKDLGGKIIDKSSSYLMFS